MEDWLGADAPPGGTAVDAAAAVAAAFPAGVVVE